MFDLDGVLLASEEVWDEVRERFVRGRGGRYDAEVQRAMMGMSSSEWSRYLHEEAGVPDEPEAINSEVVRLMLEAYRERLPLIEGAVEAVRRLAERWPLARRVVLEPGADRRGARRVGARAVLPGDGLLRGGAARQAGA